MKNNSILIIFLTFILVSSFRPGFGQEKSNWKLPDIELRDLMNNPVFGPEIANTEGPTIISFWATWCKPCIMELNNINDVYIDWQDETGVKLVAISIDDVRNVPKVAPMVNGKGWEYDVYIDANSDFRRALNVQTVPHTFLLDNGGNIVWQHNGYTPGEEEELFEAVKRVAKGESVK